MSLEPPASTRIPWADVGSVTGFFHHRGVLSPEDQRRLVGRIEAEGRWEPDDSRERQCHGFRYF
jgi:hypothetical protein